MTEIAKYLNDENGNVVYPVTRQKYVLDDEGSALDTIIGELDSRVSDIEQGHIDITTPDWDQNDPTASDYIKNKPDLSGFVTNTVNNLVNYYLKDDTYTKTEVLTLVNSIGVSRFEIHADREEITTPASNVIYLIGPYTVGTDEIYDQWIYTDSWAKIGDTSLKLENYVTTTDLSNMLSSYVTSSSLTSLLAAKQDKIDANHKLDYSLIANAPDPSTSESMTNAEIDSIIANEDS